MVDSLALAIVQMASGGDVAANVAAVRRLLAPVRERPGLVVLPEYVFGRGDRDAQRRLARPPADWCAVVAPLARECGAPVVAGGVPVAENGAIYDSALVVGVDGACLARYDKMHLFRLQDGARVLHDEADTFAGGTRPVAFDLAGWRVGLSICFDLRFPELYRALGPCDLILCPAAFTAPTGQAHWHVLLRARAIENQCYVAAAAQYGPSPAGDVTHYGHALCVDPWGEVVAEATDPADALLTVSLQRARLCEVRNRLPALACRRPGLSGNRSGDM